MPEAFSGVVYKSGMPGTTSPSASTIRAWAREAGLEVAERGRLRPEVVTAYEVAHRGTRARKPATATSTAAKPVVAKQAADVEGAPKKAPVRRTPRPTPAPAQPAAATPAPAVDDIRIADLQAAVEALTERVAQLEKTAAAAGVSLAPRRRLGRRGQVS